MNTNLPDRRNFLIGTTVLAGAAAAGSATPVLETSRNRVVTNLKVTLPYIGTVKARSTKQIESSNWLLGCETLDRDFADYEQYKEYVEALGIKKLRLQGGWSKTEKVPGKYDFEWLDRIIDDAVSRGCQPWVQTSYGNALYPGGGGDNLGAGLPTSAEALKAYDRWVEALATRYKDKVLEWEVWNEPNFGDNTLNTPEMTADFNVRTATILKRIQPKARISGLALGHFNLRFVEKFFDRLATLKAFDLFDNFTYHDYVYNPDSNRHEVYLLRQMLRKHSATAKLRQGENGAPSAGGTGRGALWDNDWSELTQAKWNTRRMLGNLGMDIECSIFGIIEMNYTNGPINKLNYKGLLKSDETKRVVRPKTAYYAVQNVAAVFDHQLERITDLEHTHNLDGYPAPHRYSHTTDRSMAVFGYRHKTSGLHAYTLWLTDNMPMESNELRIQDFGVAGAKFEKPVWVDVVSGAVHEIPEKQWTRTGTVHRFKGLPVYDSPVLLMDKSLVPMGS
jgi:hypothetical protein